MGCGKMITMIYLDQRQKKEINGICNGALNTEADYFNRAILHTAF